MEEILEWIIKQIKIEWIKTSWRARSLKRYLVIITSLLARVNLTYLTTAYLVITTSKKR